MRIQRKSGRKPRGRACEAYPFGDLKEIDEAAVNSLRGHGRNHLEPTYGLTRWNGYGGPAK